MAKTGLVLEGGASEGCLHPECSMYSWKMELNTTM